MADASAPSADGILIHYHAEGQGEPVLLFVHCWSCSSAFWEEQVKYFAPTHRVVTLDLAGHGASGMRRKRYTIEAFGQDVRAVAEALDLKKVVLIGHSMGGPVALEAARLMPDRVVGLVPIDTLQDADMHPTPQQLDSFLDAFKKDFPTATRNLVRQIVPPTADTKIVASIADHMASASSEVGISAAAPGPASRTIASRPNGPEEAKMKIVPASVRTVRPRLRPSGCAGATGPSRAGGPSAVIRGRGRAPPDRG